MTQIQKETEQPTPKKPAIEIRKVPEMVFLFLMDLVIPGILAAIIIYYLSGVVRLPAAYQSMTAWIYIGALTLFSAVIAIAWYEIPRLIRKKEANPTRWIKIGVSGVLIPVVVLFFANSSMMPTGETYLQHYLPANLIQGVAVPPAPTISGAIFQSNDNHTKTLGIIALGQIHNPANLNELMQVLTEQTVLLNQPVLYQTFSDAIASYGVDAKPALLAAFRVWSQAIIPSPESSPASLYDRYFADSILALRSAISHQDVDINSTNNDLQQMNGIQARLEADLAQLHLASNPNTAGDLRLDFTLDTFYRMNLQQDPGILTLARSVAANTTYPPLDRQKALLLIGKYGSREDLPDLMTYLQNSNDLLKSGALEAMILINEKMGGIDLNSSQAIPAK